MGELIFTTKTSLHGKWDNNIPSANDALALPTVGVFVEHTGLPALSIPGLSANDTLRIKLQYITSWSGTVVIELRKANGVTVIESLARSAPGLALFTYDTIVTNPADFQNMRLFLKPTNQSGNATLQQGTVIALHAKLKNITDLFRKIYVRKVYFYNMSGSETIEGTPIVPGDNFSVAEVNAVTNGLVWSGNSGNVIYDWEGTQFEPVP